MYKLLSEVIKMEKIEFDNLETGDQIKVAINVIISRYNKLKDIPRF